MKTEILFIFLFIATRALCSISKCVNYIKSLKRIKQNLQEEYFFIKNNFLNNKKNQIKKWKIKENCNNYINLYTIKKPLKCKVIDKVKLVREKALHEVYNLIIYHNGMFKYIEGQSCGIIPYYKQNSDDIDINTTIPRVKNIHTDEQSKICSNVDNSIKCDNSNRDDSNKINPSLKKARLYSISSCNNSPYLSIAVKIHTYEQKNIDNVVELKYGCCSGFVKKLKKNDNIYLTGAYGNFVLPTDFFEKNKNLILVATGTGISPYIGFLKKILKKNDSNKNIQKYNGTIYLFYGIYNEDSILYLDDLEYFKKIYPNNLHIYYIFSINKNIDGSSYYVQDEVVKKQKEIIHLFNKHETEMYICGHKGMKTKILQMLKNSNDFDASKKKNVHIEVY
ncbi:ferredoxin--NADP reductase [Hepatocystis sp. ex Piliocolobus tephrosceles]|nr:ferredoxin--NADP reductase [Hepatocystis sp. ex Piliocolobus tephrosceles]